MRFLVTAGPTREPLDPVRFLSNRSSGKMGYAIAAAARHRGHEVVLVSGPVALRPPRGVRVCAVTTAAELLAAVRRELRGSDVLVMAAAVADWRPAVVHDRKLKRAGRSSLTLRLVPAPDVLRAVGPLKGRRLFVGFAAETGRLVAEAARKLAEKRLDLIVANDVRRRDAGFEVDTNRVVLLYPDGALERWPLLTKRRVAARLVARIERLTGSLSRRPQSIPGRQRKR